MGKILVVGLDADGCLYHENLRPALRKAEDFSAKLKVILDNNQALWANIGQHSHYAAYSKTVVTIGSSRQSARIDHSNSVSGTKPLFFPTINEVVQHLCSLYPSRLFELDPILLADVANKKPGAAFYQATAGNACMAMFGDTSVSAKADCAQLTEKSKLLLLYTQMHYLAEKYPEDEITFAFYDDNKREVLKPLHAFFTQHKELMPTGLRLILSRYDGVVSMDLLSQYADEIVGCGSCDSDYFGSVKYLAELLNIEAQQPRQVNAIHELQVNVQILNAWKNWLQEPFYSRQQAVETNDKSDRFQSDIEPLAPIMNLSIFAARTAKELTLDIGFLKLGEISGNEAPGLHMLSPQSPNA